MEAIIAQNITKSFRSGQGSKTRITKVLKGISITINLGEMVSIVGSSGSGKSTLLYCLSGLEAADSGSIKIMGKQLVNTDRNSLFRIRRDHIGFIFQSYNLIPSLNVFENVSLPARLAGHAINTQQINDVLASIGLGGRGKDRPTDMSGGEQQRVAIARALADSSDIIFADEPTGALDTENGREVLKMLRSIGNNSKRAVVMVTHNLEAAALADRVLVLKDGVIIRELTSCTAAQILTVMES